MKKKKPSKPVETLRSKTQQELNDELYGNFYAGRLITVCTRKYKASYPRNGSPKVTSKTYQIISRHGDMVLGKPLSGWFKKETWIKLAGSHDVNVFLHKQ